MWPIDASKVTVYIDDVGLLNSKTKMWYVVNTNGQQRVLKPEEILHFKNGITLDGLVGVPTMEYLKSTLENSASADKFINNTNKDYR
ncbi:phage portal protein [Bacillus cereus]